MVQTAGYLLNPLSPFFFPLWVHDGEAGVCIPQSPLQLDVTKLSLIECERK